ncbi:unnamed protein product [Rhodiola kirilowii]
MLATRYGSPPLKVMRRSRNCNVDVYKMVQHKVKRIVGRCN